MMMMKCVALSYNYGRDFTQQLMVISIMNG